jgi:hypothetical protein
MRLRKAVEGLWKLSSLRDVIASDLGHLTLFSRKIFQWIAAPPLECIEITDLFLQQLLTHASLHMNFQK